MRAPYRTLLPRAQPTLSPAPGWCNDQLLIRDENGDPRRARLMGALTGESVAALVAAVDAGAVVLDLSDLDQIDHHGVRALATLSPSRCTLVGCPRWLELWLTRVRRHGGG